MKTTPAATRAVLFAGCKADQTSADAYFNGRYSGAFTYYFLKALAADGAASRTALLNATSQSLGPETSPSAPSWRPHRRPRRPRSGCWRRGRG